MTVPIILASGSAIRAQMLRNAAVPFRVELARVDEEALKESLQADGASPRDTADALAEMKGARVSARFPDALVIGCDQVLDFGGQLISKPETPQAALEQLRAMRGRRHALLSAAVICQDARPLWRHVGKAVLTMRELTDDYLETYVRRNWDSIRHSVGAYKLEEEGVRLFSAIDGNYFNVLGMPLMELLSFLMLREVIEQ